MATEKADPQLMLRMTGFTPEGERKPIMRVTLPLFGFMLLLALPLTAHAAGLRLPATPDCQINSGTCSKTYGDITLTLDIQPKPVKVMKELTFTVTVVKGKKDYDRLSLDLQMVGMNMGPNQVTLLKAGPGRYTGKGIIPKCHSGKKLWAAIVALPDRQAEIPFAFDVQY
jgi:hypothetical protein